jgi:hypothetical protein
MKRFVDNHYVKFLKGEGQPEKQVIALAEHISTDVMTDIMSVLETEYTVESFLGFVQSRLIWNNSWPCNICYIIRRLLIGRRRKRHVQTRIAEPESVCRTECN